ncbi:MAG: hypothetical protein DMF68_18425 [Acidobacteria bacterium]|nr:MAG: hypothetical protein DMF68_18425 [Acidobacteriota bacterium]
MKVTADMKIKDVLKINEQMIEAFCWLAPQFERLRHPRLRRLMAGRVSVRQAARIADIPLAEALYLLNLAAGVDEKQLASELEHLRPENFECISSNPPQKPRELLGLTDDDPRVHFVDVTLQAERNEDPQPAILRETTKLHDADEVLLVRHPFNPIPLRDLLATCGFASWAEERQPFDWYIYFYRPIARAGAAARPVAMIASVRAMAMGA